MTPRDASATGRVILVGGGPGHPDLITVAGLKALQEADVILYDHLAPTQRLADAKPGAVLIDVGKIPGRHTAAQEHINALLIEHARQGSVVVRLKGGDPFVFGRGFEECQACSKAGIPVRVIPGVTSAVAAPAAAGIPLTHRELVHSFSVVSGHLGPHDPASTVDWGALARTDGTIVILIGVAHLGEICVELRTHDLPGDTPAAVVMDAGMPDSATVRGTLTTLPDLATAAALRPPAVIIIGPAVSLPDCLAALPESP
jgi:uroporphyrin-III C-methyltransferase